MNSGLIECKVISNVTDAETGKICGALVTIKCLSEKLIAKKGNSFIKEPQTLYLKKVRGLMPLIFLFA